MEYGATSLCHQYDDWDKLPFHQACKIDINDYNSGKFDLNKNIEICNLLIPYLSKEEIVKVDKYNKTLLHYAVSVLSQEHLQYLFENGAQDVVEIADKYGKTSLHEASKWGNIEAINLILIYSNKAILNTLDIYGKSPLHEAAMHGREKTIQILLNNGANFEIERSSGCLTAFEEARNKFGLFKSFKIFSPYMNKTKEQQEVLLNELLRRGERVPTLQQSNSLLGTINSNFSNLPVNFKLEGTDTPSQKSLERDGIAWIHARNNDLATINEGKWMVFCSANEVDAAWYMIHQGVQSGNLYHAKVSTVTTANKYKHKHVIVVYTKDYKDINDVIRVHDYLHHHLGCKNNLYYKKNDQTQRNVYSGTSSEKPWIYDSKTLMKYRKS